MNQTLDLLNVCEFMKRHLVDVFETMLQMQPVLATEAPTPPFPDRVSGSVGFAGENVNGAIYLHLSTGFATRLACTMLGLKPEEIGEADINDVVGEVANMLTGGLKSWLCDAGAPCAVSTPAIIRGTAFAIEPMPDVEHACLPFHCDKETVLVEIHVKFI